MEKNRIIAVLCTVMLAVLLFGSTPQESGFTTEQTHSEGYIRIYKNCPDLSCTPIMEFPNTVTNVAHNQTRDVRGNLIVDTNTTWTAMLLSTGTTAVAATDTICEASVIDANGFSPAEGAIAVMNANTGNYSISKTWTASGTQAGIAKVCLANSTSTTTLIMASAKFPSALTLNSGETLTVVYYMADS